MAASSKAWEIGRTPDRPAKIFINIMTRNFGEFASRLVLGNSVANLFDHSVITVLFRSDAPFKRDMVNLLPGAIPLKCAPDAPLPSLDLINPENRLDPGDAALRNWFKAGMSSFMPAEGLLDLSVVPDSSLLQTFAISRSRFFYGSPSGSSAVADAFLVPSAITSAVDYVTCNDNLLIRTVDLVTPDGRLLRQRPHFEEGFESLQIVEALLSNTGYQMSKNALPEMIRLANFIYDMTADQTGWRDPAPSTIGPRPNQFVWPPGPPLERGIFLPV